MSRATATTPRLRPPRSRTRRAPSPGRLSVRLCLSAPFGMPVDAEPAAAARAAADALAALGHDVGEWTPPWDDEAFPSSWATFMTGTGQHLVRVIERLHGQPVDAARLEPATRAWLLEAPPMPLVDHLEAAERLWAFGRRMQAGWAPDEILLTPTLTRLPAPVGGIKSQAGVTDDASRFSALVRIWNVTGQPAISLPLSQTGDGVPVGVQLVGAHGQDHLLLSVAAQLEAAVGWKPAGLPTV